MEEQSVNENILQTININELSIEVENLKKEIDNHIQSNQTLLSTVNELNCDIIDKNIKIQELEEEIQRLENESEAFDKLIGYSPNMTYEDKLKLNEESEKELEQAEMNLDLSTKRIYENDIEREDRLIDCALGINELQFEVSEIFQILKKNIDSDKYDEYKKHKRNFYGMIEKKKDKKLKIR